MERTLITTRDIGEIGTVGKGSRLKQIRCGGMGREGLRGHHHEQKCHPQHTLGQTEEETATLAKGALCRYHADIKEMAGLAVLVDDALAVHQSKAMSIVYFLLKEGGKQLGAHTWSLV